jgi:hypothetical protein
LRSEFAASQQGQNMLSAKAEETTLLEDVTRRQPMKTEHTENN